MLDLIMAIHCHQPVGNFDHVFDKAHANCYRPILELLESHSSVKAGLHFSGPLLEWFEDHRPDTLDLLAHLIQRGQVEPLSGGFFEPLLATIPERDARGQVLMMNEYILKRFGRKPLGFWLTERIWDPNLPRTLAGTEVTYTIVDDTHFYYAGLTADKIYGRYITEKEGHTMSLLATPMEMRYVIPFRPVEDVIGHLRGMHAAGRGLAVYGDDGEKFGLWPGTHDWVIQQGWLNHFFSAVAENADWLRTVLPGDFVADSTPLGRLYLPPASYEEMTEWALPPEQGETLEDIIASLKNDGRWEAWRPFVRGGVWDNFLVKYDESNRMHKKMLFISERVDNEPEAREALWRGQCNCAYWHGLFGGLYMGHLRRAIHENLIRAHARLAAEGEETPQLITLDFDKDGAEEIIIGTPSLSLGLDPQRGGALFDLCHLGRALNLSDTLTRRREAYHRRLQDLKGHNEGESADVKSIHEIVHAKEEGLERLLIVDGYTRCSLLDHVLDYGVGPEAYAMNHYEERGDFIQGTYQVQQAQSVSGEAVVTLIRQGRAGSAGVALKKTLRCGKGPRFQVNYELEGLGPETVTGLYGCEFNLNLFSDQDDQRYYSCPETGGRREVAETGSEERVTTFALVNGPDRLTTVFTFSRPMAAWFYPLMTVSQSEDGFERTYQGSSLLFMAPLELAQGERFHLQIDIELVETQGILSAQR